MVVTGQPPRLQQQHSVRAASQFREWTLRAHGCVIIYFLYRVRQHVDILS